MRAAGDDGSLLVARREGKLLAFILTLRDGDTAIAYHIGFDRDVAGTGVPLYLRMLHASIEQSIRFGCRRV